MEDEFFRVLSGLGEYPGYEPFRDQISAPVRRKKWITEVFPHGHIIAVLKIMDCVPTACVPVLYPNLDTLDERAFGDFTPGRWGWVTEELFRLPSPIRYAAHQGINDLSLEIVDQIREQWRKSKSDSR